MAYTSVPCAFHKQLELSVLRRLPLLLTCRDEAGEFHGRIISLDVYTHEGAEWLRYRQADGTEAVARLDHIVSAKEMEA
jgi:transcriptional antiterminator Rof (Rho-off)